ncbi:stage III sporulation protein AA, partial [mine drainage metagenome]
MGMPVVLVPGPGPNNGPWSELRPYVAGRLAHALDAMPRDAFLRARELRLRVGRPASLLLLGGEEVQGPEVTGPDLAECLEHLTQHSLYAWEAELGNGFLTIPGGHRVGVAGRVVETGSGRRTVRDIGSLNYRIARSVEGIAGRYIPRIAERGRLLSTLIVGPPGCGKTTLLRD